MSADTRPVNWVGVVRKTKAPVLHDLTCHVVFSTDGSKIGHNNLLTYVPGNPEATPECYAEYTGDAIYALNTDDGQYVSDMDDDQGEHWRGVVP